MYDFLAYLTLYIFLGLLLWLRFPQQLGRTMPRDAKTHRYTPKFSTFLAVTLLWPLALLHS